MPNIPYAAKMNWPIVCVLTMSLAACGAQGDAGNMPASATDPAPGKAFQDATIAPPAAPAQGEVTDEKIGLPVYPGATEVEYSRVKLHSDVGDAFSVAYQTTDSPTQVAAFYQLEAAKLGTMKESMSTSELLKSVAVDRTDGSTSTIQARTDGKGNTLVSIHRFFPAK